MKTRRNIYFLAGSFLIVFNLIVYISHLQQMSEESSNASYSIGSFIGANIPTIIGLILVRMAYKLHARMKQIYMNEVDTEVNNIGNND